MDKLARVGVMLNKDFRHKHNGTKCPMNNNYKRVFSEFHKRQYKPGTLRTYKQLISTFNKWIFELDEDDKVPCLRRIKIPKDTSSLRREDLLTDEQIEKLIRSSPNPMHRALVSCIYEGQLRPGETLNLTRSDVIFNGDHVKLYVKGKMEAKQGSRSVFLLKSYDLLKDWLAVHPGDTEALWVMKRNGVDKHGPMTLQRLDNLLKKISNKAIQRPINCYLLRHSKITQNYLKFGEALSKKMAGHSPDSRSAKRYLHLVDEDILGALRGELKPEKIEKDTTCPRCKHKNGYSVDVCTKCGFALELTGIRPEVNEDAVKQMVVDVLKSLGLRVENLEQVKQNHQHSTVSTKIQ